MKKIALVLSLAFLAFSCSSDDSGGGSVSESDLVGTWKLTLETILEQSVELDECQLESTITFTSTEYSSSRGFTSGVDDECNFSNFVAGSYDIDDDELFLEVEFGEGDIEEVYEGDISLSGNSLTIDDEEIFEDEVFGSKKVYTKVN